MISLHGHKLAATTLRKNVRYIFCHANLDKRNNEFLALFEKVELNLLNY